MTKRDIHPVELKFINEHRGSHLKYACRRFQKIRESVTGVSEGLMCHCKLVSRKIYSKGFFEWFDNLPDE